MAANASYECSIAAVQQYLNDALTDKDAARIEAHLGVCAECRRTMEDLAADPEFWKTANLVLADPPIARDQTVDVRLDETTVLPPHGVRLFVENYLESSEAENELGVLDGYAVESVIGTGAAGIVLSARDTSLRRHVAIKVLQPTLSGHPSARERFQREAQAMAAVEHANVIDVYAVSEYRGLPYLVMPLIDGPSLATYAEQHGPLPLPELLSLGKQMADGLAAAHEHGLIHRDIKPSNILLNSACDQLVITDFGLVRAADNPSLTESGVIPGTPQYMSPEQARGDDVDTSTDLFSLGSVLYLLATGRTAFSASTVYGTLRLISDGQTKSTTESNSELPEYFQRLIELLHDKDPDRRLSSASRLSKLLQQTEAHLAEPHRVELPADLRAAVTKQPSVRRYLLATCAAAAAVTMFVKFGNFPQPTPPELIPEPASVETPTRSDPIVEPLRYHFSLEEPSRYLTAVSVKLPNGTCEIDGLVTIHTQDETSGQQQLSVDFDLRLVIETSDSSLGTGSRRRWQRIDQQNAESVGLAADRTLLSRSGNVQIPFVDLTLIELLFPDSIPGLAEATNDDTITYVHSLNIGEHTPNHRHGAITSVLQEESRVLVSVRSDLNAIVQTEFETRQMPVLVSFQRITAAAAAEWKQHEAENVNRKTLMQPPLTAEQINSFLADVKSNRRVSSWLQKLQRRDPGRFTSDVVDALVLLQDHSDATCSIMAREIVSGIPEPLLNPFRVTQ